MRERRFTSSRLVPASPNKYSCNLPFSEEKKKIKKVHSSCSFKEGGFSQIEEYFWHPSMRQQVEM